ncbi:MAG: hypothetical protein HWN69_09310 [Desulfobacterales bacterium]|nr:hypothetical protein [Desulfobacterales bacterium]
MKKLFTFLLLLLCVRITVVGYHTGQNNITETFELDEVEICGQKAMKLINMKEMGDLKDYTEYYKLFRKRCLECSEKGED